MERSPTRPRERAQALRAADRVKRRSDFLDVQAHGRRVSLRHFLVVIKPRRDVSVDADTPSRIGITITKKVSGAVGRNRVKRLVREVFRQNRSLFPRGCDVVFIARNGADALDYAAVLAEVTSAKPSIASPSRKKERAS